MNLKFFGEWCNKKYPFNIEKNPDYYYDNKIWAKIPEDIRKEIVESATKTRVNSLSITFWIVILLIGLLFLLFLLAAIF